MVIQLYDSAILIQTSLFPQESNSPEILPMWSTPISNEFSASKERVLNIKAKHFTQI